MRSRFRRILLRLAVGMAGLAGTLLVLRWIFFLGPYLPVTPLPVGNIVDLHCHTGGIGAGGSGCHISGELRANRRFATYLKAFGVEPKDLEEHGDILVIQRLADRVENSRFLDAAVVLAMDGVVSNGQLDLEQTEFHVPNEFVARETARYPHLYFGASVNPLRHDALEQLEWCKTNGAVLVKWLPSIMLFDPADEAFIPFYEKLKALELPLLTHAGHELSFTHARNELADPLRLRLPLDLGVTVIVAHMASSGKNEGQKNWERLLEMFDDYPNLYTDISTLTQINRMAALKPALLDSRVEGRLLFGTDYPLINISLLTSPWWFPRHLTFRQMREIGAVKNPFDRDILLKQALGTPGAVFERPAQLLNLQDPALGSHLNIKHSNLLPSLRGDPDEPRNLARIWGQEN
jgi:uncharacterized protein